MTDGSERASLELELKLDLDLRATGSDFKLELDVITRGSAVGVFGASGSGKTTLLETIAGLRRQAEQRVRLGSRVFSDRKRGIWLPPERRATGFVPQSALLFPHLNVRQNLLVGARRAVDSGRPGLVIDDVAALLELETLLERSTWQLSGGEQQRVALARALLSGPDLLLLDEPFSGVDAPLRQRLLRLVLRVRDQFRLPMLFVSHDPREVLALCDHVIVLERGRMLTQGAPRDVLEG